MRRLSTLTIICLGLFATTADASSVVVSVPLYVDSAAPGPAHDGTSWCTAFTDLQDALDVARESDGPTVEIRVADGIYTPDRGTGDRTATFQLLNGVTIRGGYAGCGADHPDERDIKAFKTILSGDLANDDEQVDCRRTSECCLEHPAFGCSDDTCEQIVCERRPECCGGDHYAFGWDEICAWEAMRQCCGFGNWCDNSLHVIVAIDIVIAATLDGCTIANGYANDDGFAGRVGAAFYGVDAKVDFANCIFRGHRATGGGSAVFARDGGALGFTGCLFVGNVTSVTTVESCDVDLTLTDCILDSEARMSFDGGPLRRANLSMSRCRFVGGSVLGVSSADPVLTDCEFVGRPIAGWNTTQFSYGRPTLSRCSFVETNGVDLTNAGATLVNCSFLQNSNVALELVFSAATLRNCTFLGNVHAVGFAAILTTESYLGLWNCTVVGNASERLEGAIYVESGGAAIANSIIWGNISGAGRAETAQLLVSGKATVEIDNSDVEGWTGKYGGAGNFDADPRFVDAAGPDHISGTKDDNVRLSGSSPCIDAGRADLLRLDVTDMDGDGDTSEATPLDMEDNPRVIAGALDLGAYEGGRQALLVSDEMVVVPEGGEASFTVALAVAPPHPIDVTVTVRAGDTDISVDSGAHLTFDPSDYADPQTVTVVAAEDLDFLNGTATIHVRAGEVGPRSVVVVEQDNDPVGPIVYVDAFATGANLGTSWRDALTDLESALRLARDRETPLEVWVAAGTYRPSHRLFVSDPRSVTFALPNAIALYGGFAGWEIAREQRDSAVNETVLSGDLAGDDDTRFLRREDNSYSVVTCVDTDASTVVDGFTITAGNATTGRQSSLDWQGGGMQILDSAAVIRNCRFVANQANQGGGANVVGGAPHFTRCVFRGNVARGGGGIWTRDATTTISDTVILGNYATYETGGLAVESGASSVVNCAIAGNTSWWYYGGVRVSEHTTIKNSLVWDNRANGARTVEMAQIDGWTSAAIDHCLVEGWSGAHGGIGNSGSDPMFVDPAGPDGVYGTEDDDLRLMPGSPAINSGDPGFTAGVDATDLAGQPRIQGCRVDRGAYESPHGQAFGDFDGDGDWDLTDVAGYQVCNGISLDDPGWWDTCLCVFDLNNSATLEPSDFAAFQKSFVSQMPRITIDADDSLSRP